MSGKRITFKQRVQLQSFIESKNYRSVSDLANKIGISRNALYTEIKNLRISLGSKQKKFLHEQPLKCDFLFNFPCVCNICPKKEKCVKEIFIYDAYEADNASLFTRYNCNKGPNLTLSELKTLDSKVSPRVLCGQSLYHIKTSDESITVSEQTIRRYINNGYLTAKNIDLPRTVQRKTTKHNLERKTRIPIKLLNGRMYEDYCAYKENNPNKMILQIDLIIGKKTDKEAILTLFEPKSKLQVGFKVKRTVFAINTKIMDLFNDLEKFECQTFEILLADNGAEFSGLPTIETNENGVIKFRVFYCDPYASYQKGGCEKNHEFFRYVIKKGVSLETISQAELNEIFSNINSYRRKSLNGKTPYEVFESLYGSKPLELFGIFKIESAKVILK